MREDGPQQHALARPAEPARERTLSRSYLTKEIAERWADELLSDLSHTVESASAAVGVKAATIRKALERYREDSSKTLDDEEICNIIGNAKAQHIQALRRFGFIWGGDKNNAGVAWITRQLETQAPLEHGRNVGVVEVKASTETDADGKTSAHATVSYTVEVPADEPAESD